MNEYNNIGLPREFGFLDGITVLSFLMQSETLKDVSNKDLLNLVHRDIIALATQLDRIEGKLDAISRIVYSFEDNKQDGE